MLKKILIGVGALILLIGASVFFLGANINSIVEATIEKYGTAATKTDVTLDRVKIMLTAGQASLDGLSVGSPKGFEAKKAMYLGSIAVKLDAKSVTGNGPIVIQEISIDKPQITYEINNSGENNLQTIMRNAKTYAASVTGVKKVAEPKTVETEEKPARKIIINDLYVRDGQIAITQPMLKGKQLSAGLPVIHLKNIGKAEGGATPADVAQKVLGAITSSASKVASSSLAKELGAGVKKAGEAAKKAGENVENKIEGLFEK